MHYSLHRSQIAHTQAKKHTLHTSNVRSSDSLFNDFIQLNSQQNNAEVVDCMLQNIGVRLSDILRRESTPEEGVQEVGRHLRSDVELLPSIPRDKGVVDRCQRSVESVYGFEQDTCWCVRRKDQLSVIRDTSVNEVGGPAQRVGDRFDGCKVSTLARET